MQAHGDSHRFLFPFSSSPDIIAAAYNMREWRNTMRRRGAFWVLPIIITLLALADGLLHLRLIYVLFRGRLWGTPSFGGPPPGAPPGGGPPPGAPRGGPTDPIPFVSLPLNELFLLNCIGFVVLVLVFWFVLRRFCRWVWVVDVVLIGFTALSIIGWIRIGKPNPMGYGHLSKEIEIALIVALLAHLWNLLARRRVGFRTA